MCRPGDIYIFKYSNNIKVYFFQLGKDAKRLVNDRMDIATMIESLLMDIRGYVEFRGGIKR